MFHSFISFHVNSVIFSSIKFNSIQFHFNLISFQFSFASFHFISFHFSRSFVHSFVHSFIRSFVRSFVPSFVHSFIRSLVRSFVHSFIHSVSQTVRQSVSSPSVSQSCVDSFKFFHAISLASQAFAHLLMHLTSRPHHFIASASHRHSNRLLLISYLITSYNHCFFSTWIFRRGDALFGINYFYTTFILAISINILYVNLCMLYFLVFHVHCCSACKVQSQPGLLGEFFRFCSGISGRGDRPQRVGAHLWFGQTGAIAFPGQWPCPEKSETLPISLCQTHSAVAICSCYVFTGSSSSKRKPTLIGLVIPRSSQSGPDEINVATPFAQLPQPLQPQLGKITCSLWVWFFYISSLIIQYYSIQILLLLILEQWG